MMNNQEFIDRINYFNSKLADAHVEASAFYAKVQTLQRQIEELTQQNEFLKDQVSKDVEEKQTNN